MKGGQKITLSVATETSAFKRPESIALQQGPGFERAVGDRVDLIPDGTVDVCQRCVSLGPHEIDANEPAGRRTTQVTIPSSTAPGFLLTQTETARASISPRNNGWLLVSGWK